MKAWEQKIVPIGFAFAGVLFLVAALKPFLKNGEQLNASFLALSVLSLAVGLATWRKSVRGGPGSPSA